MQPEEIEEYLNQTEYNARIPYGSGIKRQKAIQEAALNRRIDKAAKERMMYSAPIANVGRYFPNDSVYDKGITIYDIDRGINTYRDLQQSDLMGATNALIHGGTALGTGILGTALLTNPYGLATVAAFTALEGIMQATKEEPNYNPVSWFTNNAIFKVMDATKSFIDEATPVYTSDMDKEGLSKFAGLAGFDALSQGIGFLAGGVGGARMASKKLSEGSKFYDSLLKIKGGDKILQGKTIEEAVRSGLYAEKDLEKIRKAKDFADGVSGLTASVVGRIGESVIEAQGTKKELLEKGFSEEEADAAMNKSFLANMALSSVDYIQNIKMLGTFKGILGAESKLAKYSDDVIKAQQAGKTAFTKGDKALSVISALGKNALLEGGEEGLQFAINKAAQDSAIEGGEWLSFLKNMGSEFENSFTDEEGQLSWILGGLLGGGVSSIIENKNLKVKDKELANIISDAESLKEDLANNYKVSENGLYTVYTKPDNTKEKVINKDYINTIHHNSELEAIKQYAQETGDKALYDVAQNKQVLNKALFSLKTGNFKNFVTQLETSKDIDLEELANIKAVQENKPVSEIEVTKEDLQDHVNSVQKSLHLINDLKTTYDAAMSLPQIANLPQTAIFKLADVISSQKSIAKELESVRPEMLQILEEYSKEYEELEYKGKRTKTGKPDKRSKEYKESGLAVSLDAIQDPILKEQFKKEYDNYKDLNVANKKLLAQYESYVKNPKKLVVESMAEEVKRIKDVVKDVSDEATEKDEIVDKAVKENATVTVQTPEGEITTKITRINPETSQIETEAGIVVTPEQILESNKVVEEQAEITSDYEETQSVTEGPKKTTIYSTSTSAHQYNDKGQKQTEFTGNPWNELQHSFKTLHYNIVKFMSNFVNTPSKSKQFTAKLSLRPITNDLLKDINDNRKVFDLPALTLEDLNTAEHRPIAVGIYENGKLVSTDITHFHDADYFERTAEFEQLGEEEKKLTKQIFKQERERIIKLLENGKEVTLSIENKSNGIPNYNPLLNGKKQVNPIYEVFNSGLLGKTYGKVSTRGIGVVTAVADDSFEISFENGEKQTYPVTPFMTIDPTLGLPIFETVSANGSPYLLNCITFNDVPVETQQSLAELFTHRLFYGNEIKLKNTKFSIIGETTGLLNNLLYLGERKTAREKQIFFKKDGTLVVGREEFTSENNPEEVKEAVFNHLMVYNKYPKYPLGAINSKIKIILPTEIDPSGEILSEVPIQTIEKYLFGTTEQQRNPLIGTNINSTINFINSYFTYKKGPDGLLDIKTNEAKPKIKPFAEELSKKTTPQTTPVSTDAKADINSLIDKRTVENELTNGRYSFYPTQEAAEQDKGVVITKDNVNQAIEAEKKLGDVIYNNKFNQIAGIPTPVIQVEISSGTSFEFANAKDLQDFINNPKEDTKEREVAKKKYDELAALEGKPETKTETIEETTNKAKEINKECDGISGNKPIEPGNGGNINPDDIFN